MYAYNLEAFALNERINVGANFKQQRVSNTSISKPYAYIFRYQCVEDAKLLGALMQKGVKVRSAQNAFAVANEKFAPGTLIVTRRNNEKIENFDELIVETANTHHRKVYASNTGFVDSGKDFGSGTVNYLEQAKIAVLSGEQVSSLSFGEVWHFFEQQLKYPVTVLGTDYFNSIDLSSYNVLVVPSGYYRLFDDETINRMSEWVSNGGKLILIGNALNAFADKNGFALKRYANEESKKAAEQREKVWKDQADMPRYDEQERKSISNNISGAIYKVQVDNSHPLAFGLGDTYYTLKTSSSRYDLMENAWNVGILKGNVKPVQGFAGYRANQRQENSLVFGVQQKGSGRVIYLVDNPLYRSFWENGKLLFANAVFMTQQ
jgi:hypothetical protein